MIIENEYFLGDYEDVVLRIRSLTPFLKDMKQSGDNLMVTCPYHADGQESKPSCGISLETVKRGSKTIPEGTVHCFACNTTASLPEMISHCFSHNDQGAFGWSWLFENFSNVTLENREPIKLSFESASERKQQAKKTMQENDLLPYFEYYHPYLESRGITRSVQDFFEVGYDNTNQCITFPVRAPHGQLMGIAKRNINTKVYINEYFEKSETLYGLHRILESLDKVKKVYIVEGFVDALTLWSRKQPAIALMGAYPTDRQLEILNSVPIRQYVLMLDNYKFDKAGYKGIVRLQQRLTTLNYLYEYPNNKKDANELTDAEFLQGHETLTRLKPFIEETK